MSTSRTPSPPFAQPSDPAPDHPSLLEEVVPGGDPLSSPSYVAASAVTDDPLSSVGDTLSSPSGGDQQQPPPSPFDAPPSLARQSIVAATGSGGGAAGAAPGSPALPPVVNAGDSAALAATLAGLRTSAKRPGVDVATTPAQVVAMVERGSLRAALAAADVLLAAPDPGAPRDVLELKMVKAHVLVRLKLFRQAEAEIEALANLDAVRFQYETYGAAYPGRTGSMVPFTLRLLAAQIPFFLGNTEAASERLYALLARARAAAASPSQALDMDLLDAPPLAQDDLSDALLGPSEIWARRVRRVVESCVTVHITRKEYDLALSLLQKEFQADQMCAELASRIGRVFLEIADTRSAVEWFSRADTLRGGGGRGLANSLIDQGLLEVCRGQYAQAAEAFGKALAAHPWDHHAANNRAIALVYLGQASESVRLLEDLIAHNPRENLTPSVVFNLCTLYDLVFTNAKDRKRLLQDVAQLAAPEDLDMTLFKATQ